MKRMFIMIAHAENGGAKTNLSRSTTASNPMGARATRTRGQMPRGRIPGRVRTQSQMYAIDGVSAFGNISSRDLARLRRGR